MEQPICFDKTTRPNSRQEDGNQNWFQDKREKTDQNEDGMYWGSEMRVSREEQEGFEKKYCNKQIQLVHSKGES